MSIADLLLGIRHQVLITGGDLETILNVVLREVCDASDWEYGEVWLPTPEGERLVWTAGYAVADAAADRLAAEVSEFNITRDDGLILEAWRTSGPVWIKDVRGWGRFARQATATELSLKSAVAVPIEGARGHHGILAFFTAKGALTKAHSEWPAAAAAQLGECLERITFELALKRARSLLERTFASLHDAVFVVDEDAHRVISHNPAAERLFGFTSEEFCGQSARMLHVSEEAYRDFHEMSQRDLDDLGVYKTEYTMRRKNGSVFPSEHTVTAVNNEQGRRIAAVSVIRDLTERKAVEQESRRRTTVLARAQRLAAASAMAAGLSHEIQQPLGAIRIYANVLTDYLHERADDPAFEEAVVEVNNECQRALEIIERLREFMQQREPRRSTVCLNHIVQAALKLTAGETRRLRIGADVHLDAHLPNIVADSVQLTQVLVNLITNAVEAMVHTEPDRRRLTITTARDESEQCVELCVSDTGSGISAAFRRTIFRSFHTSKQHGLGIGLKVARYIIDAHDGTIRCDDNPGGGTRFTVHLPYVCTP